MNRKGFSLIELSVVLIIIGLLVGGVIAGTSLKKASQIQAVITDLAKYKQYALQYKDKYYYWPGDQPNVTSNFWSGAGNGDGNGNGQIGGINVSNSHPAGGSCATAGNLCITGESYYAMRALYESGFITVPIEAASAGKIIPGKQMPKVPQDKFMGMTLSNPVYAFTYTTLISPARNVLTLTDVVDNSGTTAHQSGALRPNVAYAIDKKMDDGLPSAGYVRGLDNVTTSTSCVTSGTYNIPLNDSRQCILSLILEGL